MNEVQLQDFITMLLEDDYTFEDILEQSGITPENVYLILVQQGYVDPLDLGVEYISDLHVDRIIED